MTDRIIMRLWEPVQAFQALNTAWHKIKPLLMAGHRLELEVRKETRSSAENRLLHAMLGDISRAKEWAGKKRDIETWKRLLVAAWCRATNEQIELLPALDGHGVDIVYRKTSKLTRGECADLITFVQSWCAMNDVTLRDAQQWIDSETGEVMR